MLQFHYKMRCLLQNASVHEVYLQQNETSHDIDWLFISCLVLSIKEMFRNLSKNL